MSGIHCVNISVGSKSAVKFTWFSLIFLLFIFFFSNQLTPHDEKSHQIELFVFSLSFIWSESQWRCHNNPCVFYDQMLHWHSNLKSVSNTMWIRCWLRLIVSHFWGICWGHLHNNGFDYIILIFARKEVKELNVELFLRLTERKKIEKTCSFKIVTVTLDKCIIFILS